MKESRGRSVSMKGEVAWHTDRLAQLVYYISDSAELWKQRAAAKRHTVHFHLHWGYANRWAHYGVRDMKKYNGGYMYHWHVTEQNLLMRVNILRKQSKKYELN